MLSSENWIAALERRTLLSAGDLDASFGRGGIVTQSFGGIILYPHVAVQADEKIVVAMEVKPPAPAKPRFVLERLSTAGTLDTSFGKAGKVVMALAGTPVSNVIIEKNGGIATDPVRSPESGVLVSRYWIEL